MLVRTITAFPEIFDSFLSLSLIKRAQEIDALKFESLNPRDFSAPPHHHIDDTPYGGGAGMVMTPDPLVKAIENAKSGLSNPLVIAPSPGGKLLSQSKAKALSKQKEIIFVCGRYEGIDQRVIDHYVDEEISIGDYVLMGGEVPVMVILEAVLRYLPGVLGNSDSLETESFTDSDLLEAPQYTRPPEYNGYSVPEVLLSGDHEAIRKWREEQAVERTKKNRPELLGKGAKA